MILRDKINWAYCPELNLEKMHKKFLFKPKYIRICSTESDKDFTEITHQVSWGYWIIWFSKLLPGNDNW